MSTTDIWHHSRKSGGEGDVRLGRAVENLPVVAPPARGLAVPSEDGDQPQAALCRETPALLD
jgi:hypothetical protein